MHAACTHTMAGQQLRVDKAPRRGRRLPIDGARWCWDCERYRSEAEFFRNRAQSAGVGNYCKACLRDRNTVSDWAKRGLQGVVTSGPDRTIARVFYASLVDRFGNRCGICGRTEPDKGNARFCVDHDHVTGEIRGLLCVACNRNLGPLENAKWRQAALAYLSHACANAGSMHAALD